MAFKITLLLLIVVLSASSTHQPEELNLASKFSQEALVNCFVDAIVLESIFIRVSAELATGVMIPMVAQNIEKLKKLIPEWIGICKGIWQPSQSNIHDPEIFSESFASPLSRLVLRKSYPQLRNLQSIANQFEIETCKQALTTGLDIFTLLQEAFEDKNLPQIVELVNRFPLILRTIEKSCKE